jgi:two-component system cell cycle response regulator DivK
MTAATQDTEPAGSAVTVLLIEDNDANRDMLARRLVKKGYRVLTAATGAQGFALALTSLPDLILMDVRLPDRCGLELSRTLKNDPATRAIPIIALSANAQLTDRATALSAGCDDYEPKPINLPTLLQKMQSALQKMY